MLASISMGIGTWRWAPPLFALAASCANARSASDVAPCAAQLSQWPEADALFRNDAAWLGADAAYSVDLSRGSAPRVLWLFGDTFIAKDATRSRANSFFIRNSIAIQSGSLDPSSSSAKATFAWRTANGAASSFFAESGSHWFWPLGGVRLPTRLVLFLLEEAQTGAGTFGFQAVGTKVAVIDNPDADPSTWTVTDGNLPRLAFPIAFGAAVVQDGGFVYAFGDKEPGDHSMYVARFDAAALDSGDASRPLLFRGGAWVAPDANAPDAIFPSTGALDNPPTELSVQKRADGTWLAVHSVGFGATKIATRTAPRPEGPWTPPCAAFTPPEASDPSLAEYAAKAHPELTGASLVVTYATNTASSDALAGNMNVYFPRFVRAP